MNEQADQRQDPDLSRPKLALLMLGILQNLSFATLGQFLFLRTDIRTYVRMYGRTNVPGNNNDQGHRDRCRSGSKIKVIFLNIEPIGIHWH